MKTIGAIILATSLGALRCAPGYEVPNDYEDDYEYFNYRPQPETRYYPQPNDSDDLLKSSRPVTCGVTDSECPTNVGIVYFMHDSGQYASQCTGALIAKNQFLTNSHCVDEYLNDPKADCSKKVVIHLPKSGNYEYEVHDCRKISVGSTFESPRTSTDMDYAIVELKSDSVRGLPIVGNSGIADQESLVAWVGNSSGHSLSTRIVPLKLKNVQDSVYLDNKANDFSQTVFLVGDRVVPGNSGSPVLNQKGEMVAIMQATFIDQTNPLIRAFLPKKEKHFSIGTNLSCVPTFTDPNNPAAVTGCHKELKTGADFYDKKIDEFKTKAASEKLLTAAIDDLYDWLNENQAGATFFWTLASIDSKLAQRRYSIPMGAVPYCVAAEPKLNVKIQMPIYSTEIAVDEEGRLKMSPKRNIEKFGHYFIVLKSTRKLQNKANRPAALYTLELSIVSVYAGKTTTRVVLPSCDKGNNDDGASPDFENLFRR